MPAWIIGAIALIKAIPDIISVIRELFKLFHETVDYLERKQKVAEVKEALQKANQTGDTSGLDKLFNSKNAK